MRSTVATSPPKWMVYAMQKIVRSERVIAAVVNSRISLRRRRGLFVVFRTNVFHNRKLPR